MIDDAYCLAVMNEDYTKQQINDSITELQNQQKTIEQPINLQEQGVIKDNQLKCKLCKYTAKESGYCGKHELRNFIEQTNKSETHKLCRNCIRGCRNMIDKFGKHTSCEHCREVERNRDNARRVAKNEYIKIQNAKKLTTEDGKIAKLCINCNKLKDANTFFTTINIESNKCGDCLEYFKKYDSNRNRPKRSYVEYEKRPDRIEKKKLDKINHPERSSKYSHTFREKKKSLIGVDKFKRDNADRAQLWRSNNPDKVREQYERNKVNVDAKIKIYKYKVTRVRKGKIEFKLTDLEAAGFIQADCYYCGKKYIEGEHLNGIDRKDNNLDYTIDNCVTCCTMCNYMKGDELRDDVFLMIIEHILTYNGFIEGKYYPNVFYDYKSSNYNKTSKSATKRKIEFKLSKEEFEEIKNKECYICGKQNSDVHNNGVDRLYRGCLI